MSQVTNLTHKEIADQGEALYHQQILTKVDTPENLGKIIAIDLGSGDYEIDPDLILAHQRLRDRHPEAVTWTERIGYDAVYAIGGTILRK
jgi:hypothetical protein